MSNYCTFLKVPKRMSMTLIVDHHVLVGYSSAMFGKSQDQIHNENFELIAFLYSSRSSFKTVGLFG